MPRNGRLSSTWLELLSVMVQKVREEETTATVSVFLRQWATAKIES